MLRAAAFNALANIEDDETIAPVREIRKAVNYLNIVKIASEGGYTFRKSDLNVGGIFELPACDFFGIFYVSEIDHPERTSGVISQINVMRIDVGAVNAASDCCGVLRENFRMHGIGSIEKNDAIFSIGSAFTGDDADFSVAGDADIVNEARVNFKWIRFLGMGGVGDVVDIKFVADGGEIGEVVPEPFFGELFVLGHRVTDDIDFALDVSRNDHDASRGAASARRGLDDVRPWTFSDKCTVGPDLRARSFDGPGDDSFRNTARGGFLRSEVQNVARFCGSVCR